MSVQRRNIAVRELEGVTKEAEEIKKCCLSERMEALTWTWYPLIFVFTPLVAHWAITHKTTKVKGLYSSCDSLINQRENLERYFLLQSLCIGEDFTELSTIDALWSQFCDPGKNRVSKIDKEATNWGAYGEWSEEHNPPNLPMWKDILEMPMFTHLSFYIANNQLTGTLITGLWST